MQSLKTILLSAALTTAFAGYADSVLSVRDASLQPASVVPESFETDTRAMLDNWYLKNYAVLDYDADSRPGGDLSDEVLIERLGALPTVIEMPLNAPVRNMIEFYVNRKKQLVENMLGLSLYYMPIFEEALERYGMPLELRYLPVIESALVPSAVSRAGAAGLWQFMPGTGRDNGLELNSLVDQRRDPYLSSDAAARYLKQLYGIYGDWSLAIAAYNCGPGNVNKAIRRAGGGKCDFWDIYPFLPTETRGYVPAFIAANYVMTYYKHHNISPALAKRPLTVDTVHVNRRVHFDQISAVMGIPVDELRVLNPQFRQDLIPGDIRPYSLVLPSLQVYAYLANEDSIVNHEAEKYARRGVVEPASGATVGRDSRGEYYEEEQVKYHTVRKNETLKSIARKYGVTEASLRKYNKVKKGLKAGQKLKIVTTVRRYKPAPKPEEQPAAQPLTPAPAAADTISIPGDAIELPADSIAAVPVDSPVSEVESAFAAQPQLPEVAATPAQTDVKPAQTVAKSTPAKKPEVKPANANKKAKPKTHVVRRGENLSKIAQKYGVAIKDIQRANNMAGTQIQAGQTLKIPAKK